MSSYGLGQLIGTVIMILFGVAVVREIINRRRGP